MAQFIYFLRGINVNGITIKMEALKKAFLDMGFHEVSTVLATGNVVVSAEAVHEKIEEKLSETFGYEAYVISKSAESVKTILEESKLNRVPEGYHHYALLMKTEGLAQQMKQLFEGCQKAPGEQLVIGSECVFWIVPKGDTLGSEFGKICLGKKAYKDKLTSRNINTIEKIVKLLK